MKQFGGNDLISKNRFENQVVFDKNDSLTDSNDKINSW